MIQRMQTEYDLEGEHSDITENVTDSEERSTVTVQIRSDNIV